MIDMEKSRSGLQPRMGNAYIDHTIERSSAWQYPE